jgi:hypothetical protein
MNIKRSMGKMKSVRGTKLLKVPNGIWIVGILKETQIVKRDRTQVGRPCPGDQNATKLRSKVKDENHRHRSAYRVKIPSLKRDRSGIHARWKEGEDKDLQAICFLDII